jgi:hypothetical protein
MRVVIATVAILGDHDLAIVRCFFPGLHFFQFLRIFTVKDSVRQGERKAHPQ